MNTLTFAPNAPRSSWFVLFIVPIAVPSQRQTDMCSKCSGSIKFVHPEWLSRPRMLMLVYWNGSKRMKYRNVNSASTHSNCRKVLPSVILRHTLPLLRRLMHAVYDPHMPSRVPRGLFLARLVLQLRNNLLTCLRFLLVCFIWLGVVPFLTRWIWRFYFFLGDWSQQLFDSTYCLGLNTLLATIALTEFTADKTAALLRQDPRSIRRALAVAALRVAKWGYLVLLGGIVLPLLCGATLDLYVMIPILGAGKVEMHVVQDWAYGVIAGRVMTYVDGHHVRQMRRVSSPFPPVLSVYSQRSMLTQIFPTHWTNPDIKFATRKFILPIAKFAIVALVTPLLFAYASQNFRALPGIELSHDDRVADCLATYPAFMVFAAVVVAAVVLRRKVDRWRDSVRDETYLVGEVLHNLEDES